MMTLLFLTDVVGIVGVAFIMILLLMMSDDDMCR